MFTKLSAPWQKNKPAKCFLFFFTSATMTVSSRAPEQVDKHSFTDFCELSCSHLVTFSKCFANSNISRCSRNAVFSSFLLTLQQEVSSWRQQVYFFYPSIKVAGRNTRSATASHWPGISHIRLFHRKSTKQAIHDKNDDYDYCC